MGIFPNSGPWTKARCDPVVLPIHPRVKESTSPEAIQFFFQRVEDGSGQIGIIFKGLVGFAPKNLHKLL